MTDAQIKSLSLGAFVRNPYVQSLLGSTVVIETNDAKDFANQISHYIDAMPMVSSDADEVTNPPCWPLVKKVTLYVNSPVIQDGIVLIDVPGVGDTNAARAGQAEKYLTNCDAIWIVTDIARAQTDDVVAGLLSKAMKRELLMDGLYNAATFICTRTDNPDCGDIIRRMHLDQLNHECGSLLEELAELNKSTPPPKLLSH